MLQALITTLDRFSELLGRISAVFAPAMLLVTCYVVITRYVFNTGSVATQDIVTYCNAVIFSCGAGYTLKHDAHVRVDIFYSTASLRAKAIINLTGTLLLLFPVTVFLFWACWTYVESAWSIREGSPDTGGLPYVYLLKTLIIILPGVLLTQGLAEVLRNLSQLIGNQAQSMPAPDTIEEDNLL